VIETMNIRGTLRERAAQPWPAPFDVEVQDRLPPNRGPRRFSFLPPAAAYHTLGSTYRSRATSVATGLALGRTADAAIAVERYRRAQGGRWPDSLAVLVPNYLRSVPIDPFSGREILYRASGGRAVIYSVGTNREDDGGGNVEQRVWHSGPTQSRAAPPDLGIELTSGNPR
jgi:hypothetical protein